jgi:hypothetical protein
MQNAQTFEGQNSFEAVWAILRESAERHKEIELSLKETARRQEETAKRQEETDRQMKETDRKMAETDRQMKETDRKMAETDRQIGKLGNRFGEMIEYMVMPNLVNKFRDLGFVFTKAYPHASIKDEKDNIVTEVDITLENGDKVMIVEVKSKPSIDDIKDHIERMEKVHRYASLRGDKRKYMGAVAGMVVSDNARGFALAQGFYVVEPSGDAFTITAPGGSPREW